MGIVMVRCRLRSMKILYVDVGDFGARYVSSEKFYNIACILLPANCYENVLKRKNNNVCDWIKNCLNHLLKHR